MPNEPIYMEENEYMEYIANQARQTAPEDAHPVAQITMYDMNKSLIKGLKTMSNMDVNRALEKVSDWFQPEVLYYALLNHEQHYFTMFAANSSMGERKENFIKELKDILTKYYGDTDLRDIDVKEDGAVEIWGMWNGEPSVAYLFPYDQGVVSY